MSPTPTQCPSMSPSDSASPSPSVTAEDKSGQISFSAIPPSPSATPDANDGKAIDPQKCAAAVGGGIGGMAAAMVVSALLAVYCCSCTGWVHAPWLLAWCRCCPTEVVGERADARCSEGRKCGGTFTLSVCAHAPAAAPGGLRQRKIGGAVPSSSWRRVEVAACQHSTAVAVAAAAYEPSSSGDKSAVSPLPAGARLFLLSVREPGAAAAAAAAGHKPAPSPNPIAHEGIDVSHIGATGVAPAGAVLPSVLVDVTALPPLQQLTVQLDLAGGLTLGDLGVTRATSHRILTAAVLPTASLATAPPAANLAAAAAGNAVQPSITSSSPPSGSATGVDFKPAAGTPHAQAAAAEASTRLAAQASALSFARGPGASIA